MGKISNYARVLAAKLQDVFVCDQTDSNVTTTKSVTVEQIGDAICGEQVHADLETDDQTIIGGVNEVNGKADDNTEAIGDLSQLTTSVQSSLVGAVNEVNTKAVKSTSAKPLFKIVQTGSISVTINANSYSTITANDVVGAITGGIPSGYKLVAIHRFYQTDDSCYLLGYDLSATGTSAFAFLKNPTATAKTRAVMFYFLAINSDYI